MWEVLSCPLPRRCLQQTQSMKQSLRCLLLKGSSSSRTIGPFSKTFRRYNRRLMVPFCNKKRVQDSFYIETLSFPNSCFPQADQKSSTGGRGQSIPTQSGSGENKLKRSRLLLSNFLGYQEKQEINTYNRSVQTEFLSGHSVFQNGNRKQRQAIYPTQ